MLGHKWQRIRGPVDLRAPSTYPGGYAVGAQLEKRHNPRQDLLRPYGFHHESLCGLGRRFFHLLFYEAQTRSGRWRANWADVTGIWDHIPLIDGGYMTQPEFSLYGLDGDWLIENHGVDPDIIVDNRPDLVMKGQDRNWKRR